MDQTYWHRQTTKPLFPELEWSRPEIRAQAGKLLIIGGTGYEFQAPANAYGDALDAGIGVAKVLLPDSMQKVVRDIFPEAEFAPSTPSGSFASTSQAQFMDLATWSDGVLFPGNLGRNSETTVLLESFLEKFEGQVTLTKDAADLICQQPISALHRPNTLVVLAMGQLRQLGSQAHFPRAFTTDMGLVPLVEALHEFTKRFALNVSTRHQGHYVVAVDGQVSTTPVTGEKPVWRLQAATSASVWWLQNPTKPFEAVTTAVHGL
jgi:hypothetical protein